VQADQREPTLARAVEATEPFVLEPSEIESLGHTLVPGLFAEKALVDVERVASCLRRNGRIALLPGCALERAVRVAETHEDEPIVG